VEIQIAAGELQAARAAAEELSRIADAFESKALSASAALAFGRVDLADGDLPRARRSLEEAVSRWNEIGAPYEAAVARTALAQVHRAEGNDEQALLEFQAARSVFERVGAVQEIAVTADSDEAGAKVIELRTSPSKSSEPAADEYIFRREGDYWSVAFEGSTVRLRDLKGLRYLARLLAAPGQEFHVLVLVASETGEPAALPKASMSVLSGMDAGFLLDAQAKESYRRRLMEIEEDIEDAEVMGNSERAYQAQAERDFLVRELARAVGLGGRDRRAASASERARAGVTRAIRHAMAKVQEHHPTLGEHMRRAIRTGTYCSYLPDSRMHMAWDIETERPV
jgi:tetratricopeptide (TPR) repeat protein